MKMANSMVHNGSYVKSVEIKRNSLSVGNLAPFDLNSRHNKSCAKSGQSHRDRVSTQGAGGVASAPASARIDGLIPALFFHKRLPSGMPKSPYSRPLPAENKWQAGRPMEDAPQVLQEVIARQDRRIRELESEVDRLRELVKTSRTHPSVSSNVKR